MIAFATEEGTTRLLSATQVGNLLADHSPLRLVVLNACQGATSDTSDLFSSTAATLARRGIPAVLAMQEEITDRSALELTRSFYEALADGLPVDAAVADARQAINFEGNNSLEWGTPVLFLCTPTGLLFDLTEQSPPPRTQSSPQTARLEPFVPLENEDLWHPTTFPLVQEAGKISSSKAPQPPGWAHLQEFQSYKAAKDAMSVTADWWSFALEKWRVLNVNNKFLAMVITAAVTDHSAGPPPPTGSGCSRSWAALARKLSKPIMSRMTE